MMMKKWKQRTSTIKAFTLGYRYSFIKNADKKILGNLIEEILEYGSTPEILSAFRTGDSNGHIDQKFIVQNMKESLEEAKRKDEEQRINEEVAELRRIREPKQPKKDLSKDR